MKKLLFIALLSVIYVANLLSQSCGTVVTSDQLTLENSITITPIAPTQSLPQLNRVLTIAVYIVHDETNSPGISTSDINNAITRLNTYFEPVALSFKICSINDVDNYQFNSLFAGQNENDLVKSNNTPNVINLYLVGSLYDQFQNQVCGYTYMPASAKDYIFLQKSCIAGSELAHQVGHFFNLYHTHETVFGTELVKRTGCDVTGDRCCDTEADPNLLGWVDSNCLYTGRIKDSNSDYYHPSVKNLMSFGPDACRCYFSNTQFLRMIYAINNIRTNLH